MQTQLLIGGEWLDGSSGERIDVENPATEVVVTIPATEGALAGNYTTSTTYNADGGVATETLPAAGGLPAETLTNTYNDVGLPATLTGLPVLASDR